MPEWQEGPPDSGFGIWTAKVRGSKKNLLGWLKAWEFDYDKEELADMGLGESATQDDDQVRMRHLAGVTEKKNLELNEDKSMFDKLVKMSNEADWEMGDAVVFSMKNHPAYRKLVKRLC